MRKITTLIALTLMPLQASLAQKAVKWGPAPAVFPAGAKMAVMQGDPSSGNLFTVRLEMPNGYRIAPHFHPTDEHITVISGDFLVGMGDKMDTKGAMSLKSGGFATAPAQQHHWGIARGRTIVQVHAVGPFQLTYVNPADDPSKKGVAKK
ncbi:MAG TPA: cupin domain-containing protein [Gemmatimonadaceae bacterium]|nr:cupin domain-containing protein [Gemmatimonadaceae bacterium]